MIYWAENSEDTRHFTTPICIGDIVKVEDYGCMYTTFKAAFKYFGIEDTCNISNGNCHIHELNLTKNKQWKVMNIAAHNNFRYGDIIAYIQDRNFNKLVIGIEALKLFDKKVIDTEEEVKVDIV